MFTIKDFLEGNFLFYVLQEMVFLNSEKIPKQPLQS
jgi:hypothetical protein